MRVSENVKATNLKYAKVDKLKAITLVNDDDDDAGDDDKVVPHTHTHGTGPLRNRPAK